MADARPTSRPLLGILSLLVTVLVTLSALSSPPWPDVAPFLGLPRDACGLVGRFTAALFLGILGAPLTGALVLLGVAMAGAWTVRRPRVSGVFMTWLLCAATAASLFAATVGGGPVWGHFAHRVGAGLAATSLLGPVGAGLVTGGLLLAFLVFGLPRWIPWHRTRALRPVLETALTAAMVPVDFVRDAAGDAGDRLRDHVDQRRERREAARLAREEAREARLRTTTRSTAGVSAREPFDPDGRFEEAPAPTPVPRNGGGLDDPPEALGESEPRRWWNKLIPWSRRRPEVADLDGVLAAGPGFGESAATNTMAGQSSPRQGGAETYPGQFESPDTEAHPHLADLDTDLEDVEEEMTEFDDSEPAGAPDDRQIAPVLHGAPANDLTADGLDARTLGPDQRGNGTRRRPVKKGKKKGPYALPPLELLEEKPPQVGTVDKDEVVEKSQLLLRTLADFGIQGRIGQVHPGPVITQYEYEPAAGVRISQIVSRADDIALALRASRIRIVAPIPGKAAVGIEVPNRRAELISFREIMGEIDPASVKGRLPLFLGRDIRGRPQHAFLEKMPHMLVAGTTGSGKSVCLNTCIFSLLYRNTPEDLRVLMIDPKMLELTVYDGIPHLLCPVVTDARMAAKMLNWMVGEMERRYRKMAAYGVRNIEGFKEKMRQGKVGEDAREPMPYVVVIVDELADLMLTLASEIETPIARLAQMARAVGIHLILATQRPSVDVITGVIKANFPSRIGFQVATKVDSRTILDTNGAESLLGKGDMLFLPPGQGTAIRMHGAFVSDADAENLVAFLKQQPAPEAIFHEEMLRGDGEGGADIEDDLFEDALRLVIHQGQASVSYLQRRLKVGYSRAGRLMDLLESVGAVGPSEGSKPREVLADETFLQEWMESQAQGAPGGKL